jgi:hypothetical protein
MTKTAKKPHQKPRINNQTLHRLHSHNKQCINLLKIQDFLDIKSFRQVNLPVGAARCPKTLTGE